MEHGKHWFYSVLFSIGWISMVINFQHSSKYLLLFVPEKKNKKSKCWGMLKLSLSYKVCQKFVYLSYTVSVDLTLCDYFN